VKAFTLELIQKACRTQQRKKNELDIILPAACAYLLDNRMCNSNSEEHERNVTWYK
jgi:hypothetical protein